jgi:hypothetical protein
MEGLNDLEQAVLDKILAGDHPVLATLRLQAKNARLVKRELTGVGFFCDLEVPPKHRLEGKTKFEIGGVHGKLDGLEHGAGFVLFVRDGRLDMLEGFSYDEPWPNEIRSFSLSYTMDPRDLYGLA